MLCKQYFYPFILCFYGSMTYPKEEEILFRIFHLFKDSGLGIFQVLQNRNPLYFSFCI